MILLWTVLGVVGLQRLLEIAHARRNARWLRQEGARFVRDDGFGAIVLVHVLFFVLPVVESVLWDALLGWWTALGAVLFVAGQALRYHAIVHLGRRWNTRVYVLDAPLVSSGLYGRIRHPNYVGVALELAGLPIAFGLWRTALVLTALNAVALARRIRREQAALGIPSTRGGHDRRPL